MPNGLKLLLYTAALSVILFCVAGIGFMFYHERQSFLRAEIQRQQTNAQIRAAESAADAAQQLAEPPPCYSVRGNLPCTLTPVDSYYRGQR